MKIYNLQNIGNKKSILFLSILFCCIVLPKTGFSKKFIPDYLKNRPITIVKGDTSMVFYVTEKHIKNPNEKLMYHYFFHRMPGKSRGSYLGNLIHGQFTAFTGNGKLLEQGNYKKGLKNGIWFTWHNNGEISSKLKWKNGTPHGKKTEYDKNGNTIRQYKWKDKKWELIVKKDKKLIRETRKKEKQQKKLDRKEKAKERKKDKSKSEKGKEETPVIDNIFQEKEISNNKK